jgi:tRNA1Val (adenine37-N6)-methyltransferase
LSRLFKFKQFSLDDSGAAMKLGTDAVLLGCLAEHPAPVTVLDIGTGSGVIALQLAQRFEEAAVTALEIDASAAAQAQSNFEASSWSQRLQLVQTDVTQWEPAQLFDMICCNPPFYPNSYPIADAQRRVARSQEQLNFEQLAHSVARLLQKDGIFWVILPAEGMPDLQQCLAKAGLYLQTRISIYPKIDKSCNRQIAAYRKTASASVTERSLCIRLADNSYTEAYKELTSAFYLQLK